MKKTGMVVRSSEEGQSGSTEPGSPSTDQQMTTWDPAVESNVRGKIDRSVLPLLVIGFLVFQLERMNLASALTGGFAQDIHINQATINLGNQLMFLFVVVFEIPCNMVLQMVGPRKWMSAQVCIFGIVAMFQALVRNRAGFLATRVVLGMAESGFTPGAMYTLSTWYKKNELAKRMAVFFFGMFGGNAISPLLASGVLHLDNVRGLKGWQWLFLLEGLLAVLIGLIIMLFLPGSPDNPRTLLGPNLVRFSSAEQDVLQARLETDGNQGKRRGSHGMRINWGLVWKTVSLYRRWPTYVATLAAFSTFSPLSTYSPSIMMSLGFERIQANALAAVGASLTLPVVFVFGYISDRTNRRGGTVLAAQATYLVVLIVAREVHPHVGKWSRWGLWTAVNAFAVGYHPVHNSWLQLNCHEAGERSIALALWVMFATIGMMAGAQYFQADDAPSYQNGLRTMIIMVSVAMVLTVFQISIYIIHNKRVFSHSKEANEKRKAVIYTP